MGTPLTEITHVRPSWEERLTPTEENERLAACTHDEYPPLPGATCAVCGADLTRVAPPVCDHAWPPDLGEDADCVRCNLPYSEFEVRP